MRRDLRKLGYLANVFILKTRAVLEHALFAQNRHRISRYRDKILSIKCLDIYKNLFY